MVAILLLCSYCKKKFFRSTRHINENEKLKQKHYCSNLCVGQSNKTSSINLICENILCNKPFTRKSYAISTHNFCSYSCAAQASNAKRQKKIKICHNLVCKKKFTGYKKYCSLKCIPNKLPKYTKKLIISEIQKFKNAWGRIPLKKEFLHAKAARNRFGTWNKAIQAAGFKSNPVMFAKKHTAKDGHKCDSLAEKIIDDWLFTKTIEHKRSISYPGNPKLTVDFIVGEYWIEFFGLFGEHKRYDELRKEKLQLAKKYKLKFVEIYPQHLFPKSKLPTLLNGLC